MDGSSQWRHCLPFKRVISGGKFRWSERLRLNWLTHRFHHSQVLSTLFSGFAFELPWSDIDESRSITVGKMQVVTFRSGNAILIGDPGPREFASAVLEHGWDRETFTDLYGAEPLESDYKMYDLMLRTSPSSVSIFSVRKKAVANTMMLTIKAIAEPSGAATGVFAIRTSIGT